MAVKIVTDSTSDLPSDLANSLGITVQPANVHFGMTVFKDGVEMTADEFYEQLVTGTELPTTSAPSIGEFIELYEGLGKQHDEILSIHISSKLSGTYNSALQARKQVKTAASIEVVDSQQASMGLGVIAIAAARASAQGADLREVTNVATRAVSQAQCMALLDTLEFLQRGGRVGRAKALFGTILSIKPMIIVRDGEVHELGKARTFAKALAKLQAAVRESAPIDSLSVLHATSPQMAEQLAEDLRDLLSADRKPFIARFGPALGVHVGPGAVGIGLLRNES